MSTKCPYCKGKGVISEKKIEAPKVHRRALEQARDWQNLPSLGSPLGVIGFTLDFYRGKKW